MVSSPCGDELSFIARSFLKIESDPDLYLALSGLSFQESEYIEAIVNDFNWTHCDVWLRPHPPKVGEVT